MQRFVILILFSLLSISSLSQEKFIPDTLQNITVTAFQNHRNLLTTSAPVSVLQSKDLDNYDNTSIVSAMNMLPGVNMDERSPGSYRINIRGSTLRSPFGVRNVKVYYNDIPFTDPGGNTYLQILGFYNYNSVEIIRGPSGSMYGSGMGGVIMINSLKINRKQNFSFTYGSYNTKSILAEANFSNDIKSLSIQYNRQSSDGYRAHTAMHRDVISLNATLKNTDKVKLTGTFLYGNLYYQTPGALTLNEYTANPRSARPKAGSFPSAEEAKAAFTLNYILSGFTLTQKINPEIKNQLTVYGAFAQNRNPNFRNYSRTSEPHFGARTNFNFTKSINHIVLQINAGGEYQHSFYSQRVFANNQGVAGILQTDDEVFNTQALAYLQAQLQIDNGLSFTAGSSINIFSVDFNRFSGAGIHFNRKFKNEWAPRFTVSKIFKKNYVLYATVSKGFSPPSVAELLPSTDVFNETLLAERGLNYELGGRASLLNRRLFIDITFFKTNLTNSIVQKRDSTGADYFENTGGSNEKGIELFISFHLLKKPTGIFRDITLSASSNFYDFRFSDYRPLDKDYSGNKLPGVSPIRLTSSLHLETNNGFSAEIDALQNGKIVLNDANTVAAKSYLLFGMKLIQKIKITDTSLQIFVGAQNIFNETYSLGNDINAAGGRYFNTAPGRSFYGGVTFSF